MLVKHMFKTGVLLGLFAIAGTALIAFTFDNTADRIAAEEREFLLRSIQALIPASSYDNDLYSDTISVQSPQPYSGQPRPRRPSRGRSPVPMWSAWRLILPPKKPGPSLMFDPMAGTEGK